MKLKALSTGHRPKSRKERRRPRIREHILSKPLLVNGMPVTNDGVKIIDRAFFAILSFIFSLISVRPTFRQLKTSHLLARLKVDASGKHDVAQRLQQRVTWPLCVMPCRTITSTQIQPVIWPVRYRQQSATLPPLYPQADSLSFLRLAAYRGRVMTRIAVELSLLTLCVPVSCVSRVGMSSTSINLFGVYLQSEKKLRACVTLIVA